MNEFIFLLSAFIVRFGRKSVYLTECCSASVRFVKISQLLVFKFADRIAQIKLRTKSTYYIGSWMLSFISEYLHCVCNLYCDSFAK